MRVSREVPEDLVRQLERARELERIADGLDQYRRAVAATSTLLLAAVEHGWLTVDLARSIGLAASTTSKRIRDARARRDGAPTGLSLDRPPVIHGPLSELATPAASRQWLTRAEAAALINVSPRTVQDLYNRGLLPNSRRLTGTWRAYLRADLERVRRGPRRGVYLDRKGLRRAILASRSSAGTAPAKRRGTS